MYHVLLPAHYQFCLGNFITRVVTIAEAQMRAPKRTYNFYVFFKPYLHRFTLLFLHNFTLASQLRNDIFCIYLLAINVVIQQL